MSLKNLLELSDKKSYKQDLSEERVRKQLPKLRKAISFFREYPDLFIDYIKGPDSTFNLYFYQRIFLRIAMRHRYTYATYPRAYSKSFLSMLILMIRCVLYPGSHLFVTTGGKEQAASITMSKVDEICRLLPALSNEINWDRGVSKKSKNDVQYVFKNGSKLDILAAKESSRGQRRTGGLMEECVLIDQDALNEIIIPTTNINRRLPDGTRDKKEKINKSQIYITTAGYKNSFAYSKLIDLLIDSVLNPDEYMVMGGTYKTPVLEGLIDEDFVDQLKLQGSFNEDSFEREYESKWSGDSENAFFSFEKFEKHRQLKQPEYEYSARSSKSAYYVLGVDVGRIGCTTEVNVFKVTPQSKGASVKSLVNIFTFDAEHFEDQAINIKRLYYKFQAKAIAIDANGLGIGLVDFMVKSQVDPETGETLPDFGVININEYEEYKQYTTDITEEDAMYIIKADTRLNTEAYSYAQTQISSGKVKFLIDEAAAKTKYLSTRMGQNATPDQRNEYLKPFVQTSILKEQMMNLKEENEGVNIILKQSSKSIKKDKFSAFIYGLYYIKKEEDKKKKRKHGSISDYMFFTS